MTTLTLDLEKHLVFYGSYHHNPKNVAIHMLGVPLILFSGFCMATGTGPLVPMPGFLTIPHLEPNLGTIGAIIWSLFYVLLEPVAGTALAIICFGVTAAASCAMESNPDATMKAAVAVHVISWLVQFFGHAVFERRAPALMNNLFQSIFLAPLFVWLELLFILGYRPELHARVEKATAEAIAKLNKAKAAKKA